MLLLLEILGALVGCISSNPLWAKLLRLAEEMGSDGKTTHPSPVHYLFVIAS